MLFRSRIETARRSGAAEEEAQQCNGISNVQSGITIDVTTTELVAGGTVGVTGAIRIVAVSQGVAIIVDSVTAVFRRSRATRSKIVSLKDTGDSGEDEFSGVGFVGSISVRIDIREDSEAG